MKFTSHSTTALVATTLLSMTPSVSAHSWVEYAKKLARNGTMVGEVGFARGYVPRNSTNPPYSDSIPQNILPVSGQSAYSGDEILNKFKFEKNPEFAMLEAAAGDYVAIMHLENGHTTLPENQPKKPKNRGTIYFYGTSEPKDEEKLFDVHLLWNKKGTGGDGRGQLLATRNYDDGQCYQTNPGELSTQRASSLADQGAEHDQELACQSDIKLPDNLKPGSIYTIYWYWDWPDLNSDAIDIEATADGKFPWAGTFMRGEKDPNGLTMDAIARNESYASVIDIKIVGSSDESFAVKDLNTLDYVENQNIYSVGILEQMKNNFQVDVDGGQNGGDGGNTATPSATTTPAAPTTSAPADGGSDDGVATVTVTQTVAPPASVTTVYVTVPADQATETPKSTSTKTKTVMVTKSVTKSGAPESVATPSSTSTVTQTMTTHISSPQTSSQTTSTFVLTLTTHISPPASSTQSTSTVYKTMTTHISSSPSGTTVPGGQFRETPVPAESSVPTATSSTGAIVPTPFMRRRRNWAFGAF
ncbi:hypothetical protein QQZ08_003230 [Neonectria magnoliae]|uniref:DUF7492 domain-containing protein n=1 Tax=Neonectria magnoliae TaxID=2732573 RepID=A0ABR1I9Y4_9HYPO